MLLGKIHAVLLNSVLRRGEKYNLKHLLNVLRDFLGADLCYWFFLDGSRILSMVIDHDEQIEVKFPLLSADPRIELHRLSSTPRLSKSRSASLYGGIELESSLTVPLHEKDSLIAVVEFGSLSEKFSSEKASQVIAIIKYLHNVYESVYEDMHRFETSRKLRTELSHAERQFRVLFENTQDIMLSFKPDGKLLTVNEPGRIALHLEADPELWGFAPVSPDIPFLRNLVRHGNAVSDIEVVLGTEETGIRFYLATFAPEMDIHNEVSVIHGILKDITDRIESQRSLWHTNMELTKAKQMLESTQCQMIQQEKLASIGQLAAGIAHEINNPLGFIMSNHEMLKEYLARLIAYTERLEERTAGYEALKAELKAAKAMEQCPLIIKDSDEGFSRISAIIKSLKDFSRTETRGELAPVLLEKLIEDTLTVSRNSWKYVAEVKTFFELNEPVEAYGDLLNQVFMNIIVNAAQAIAKLGKKEPGEIRITTYRDGGEAVVAIADTGPGIPDELINRIFDPFFTTKPIGEGTGLGLSVSYDIISKKHKGHLYAENMTGGGARFVIRIPMEQQHGLEDE